MYEFTEVLRVWVSTGSWCSFSWPWFMLAVFGVCFGLLCRLVLGLFVLCSYGVGVAVEESGSF